MALLTRLSRIARLATLPETRRVIAAARSERLRDVARRAVRDRGAIARGLRSPAHVRAGLSRAVRHPAAIELGTAGLTFLPARYLPLGWAASWALRRIARRHVDRPAP